MFLLLSFSQKIPRHNTINELFLKKQSKKSFKKDSFEMKRYGIFWGNLSYEPLCSVPVIALQYRTALHACILLAGPPRPVDYLVPKKLWSVPFTRKSCKNRKCVKMSCCCIFIVRHGR